MTALFLKVVYMSIVASIVILFVIAVRFLLRKSPKVFSYALWGVVIFRLLCPVSLQSPISIIPKQLENASIQAEFGVNQVVNPFIFETNEVTTAAPVIDDVDKTASDSTMGEVKEAVNENADAENQTDNEALIVSDNKSDTWSLLITLASYLWPFGVLAMLLYSIYSLSMLEERLYGATKTDDNIYVCKSISTPFVLGIIRPKIYIPSGLSESETKYIILHEQVHISRCDHIVKIIAFAALSIHWFNPLVWLAFRMLSSDMEMSCDEAVIAKSGTQIKADYSASLLSLATGRRLFSGSPLAFGEGNTKSRIKNILGFKKSGIIITITSVVLCAFAVIICIFNPVSTPYNLDDYNLTEKIVARSADGEITVVYYPEADEEALIVPAKARSQELCSYFESVSWVLRTPPADTLSSPGSIQISLEGMTIDVYEYKNIARIKSGDDYKYFKTGKGDFDRLYSLISSQRIYVSEECIFMHPLSSYAAIGGDSGILYTDKGEQFVLEYRNGAVNAIDPVQSKAWQDFPWSEEQWSDLFVMSGTKLKMVSGFFDKAMYRSLSDDYALIKYNGNIWIVEFRENKQMGKYIWSIFSLVDQESKGKAVWEFAPYISSHPPGFAFRFDFPYTEISAVSIDGRLLDLDGQTGKYQEGTSLSYKDGHKLYWSPGNYSKNKQEIALYADEAKVSFTVNNNDKQIAAGCIYIEKTGETRPGQGVYTARIVGRGLTLRQDENTGMSIIEIDNKSVEDSEISAKAPLSYNLDLSLENGSNKLSNAIRDALDTAYRPNTEDDVVYKRAFEILFSNSSESIENGAKEVTEFTHTVGMLVAHRFYKYEQGKYVKTGGSDVPVVMEFTVDGDGDYELKEYKETRSGAFYYHDINSMFSGEALEYVTGYKETICKLLEQEIEKEFYNETNTSIQMTVMQEIELLLTSICSSPSFSSNPGDYIEENADEYARLIGHGEYTLRYCFGEFLKGGQNGLKGHIMAIACRDILNDYEEKLVPDEGFMTGQAWFDAYKAAVDELYESTLLLDFMERYKGAYILKQIG